VLKERFGTELDEKLVRMLPFLARTRVRPDALTLTGVGVSCAAAVAFALHQPFAAAFAIAIGGLFDAFDGVVARQQGNSSKAGAFFDASMDRLSDMVVFCGIGIGMARDGEIASLLLVWWALIASVMTSYTHARAEAQLSTLSVGLMERAERVLILAVGALLGFVEVALWLIAIGATITTIQRVVEARRLLHVFEETGRDPTRVRAPLREN